MFPNGATLDEIANEYEHINDRSENWGRLTKAFYIAIGVAAYIAFPYTAYRAIRGLVKVTRK